ncbi:hypothetical protein ACGFI9_22000 [Micromonospora sp. NPDC048930]|uniref:hypothetical protein n=1 Tax=Micromonospora sp. NPDC048930 TaxID=3364261 RepID=UPI00371924F5
MPVTWQSGMRLVPARLNALPRGILGRAERTTTSPFTSAATELPILRLDAIPVVSGRLYHVRVVNVHIDASAASTDMARGYLRVSTAGAATTASTQLAAASLPVPDTGGIASGADIHGEYVATATGTLSVLFSIARITGATANMRTLAGTGFNLELSVVDAGIDPGDTGVTL